MARRRLGAPEKKAADERAHLVLIDESGFFLNPTVRRTWAPVGGTPVLRGWGRHRDKVSAIAALTVSPVRGRVGLYFDTAPGGYYDTAKTADFLEDLLRHLRGKVIVVWDGGPNHGGPALRDLLARHPRLTVERLPGYSPHLNPVEVVWAYLKYGRLANFLPGGVAEVDERLREVLEEARGDPALLRRLWQGSELPFPHRHYRPDEQ